MNNLLVCWRKLFAKWLSKAASVSGFEKVLIELCIASQENAKSPVTDYETFAAGVEVASNQSARKDRRSPKASPGRTQDSSFDSFVRNAKRRARKQALTPAPSHPMGEGE